MFKERWAGRWLLIGLVGSVVLRGALWVITFFAFGPLLGPVDLLSFVAVDRQTANVIWVGDIVASFLIAMTTGVACYGLRRDRNWAHSLGRVLTRLYIVLNAVSAAVCGVLTSYWELLGIPLALYIASIVIAILAAREMTMCRPSATAVRKPPTQR